jgi:hypothetical protein
MKILYSLFLKRGPRVGNNISRLFFPFSPLPAGRGVFVQALNNLGFIRTGI